LLSFGKNVLAGVPLARPTRQSRFLLSSAAPPKFRCDHTSSLYRSEARVRSTFALLVGRLPTLLGCVLLDTRYVFIILLPCQWKYWHRAKNRLRDKTGFGMYMYNPQNVEKSGFGQCVSVSLSVCVSVCLSVRLSVGLSCCRFSRELSRA